MRSRARELVSTLPLPLAQLVRRCLNGKSAVERHHSAYYLAEATLKLAAAARIALLLQRGIAPGSELSRKLEHLALASTGHWVGFLRDVNGALAALPDAALLPLARGAAALSKKRPDWKEMREFAECAFEAGVIDVEVKRNALGRGVLGFFELCAAYRTEVMGHGAQRSNAFYERAGKELLEAVVEALSLPELLGGLRLQLCIEDEAGELEWQLLEGLAGIPGEGSAQGATPGQLYFVGEGATIPLYPLLAATQDELSREQIGFLNRTVRRVKKGERGDVEEVRRVDYLDYASGESLSGVDARAAVAAILAALRGSPVSVSEVDAAAAEAALSDASSPEVSEPISQGSAVIGDFELLGEIGRGGMGIVYRARQLSLNRVVALKVLPPALAGDATALGRFQREIAVLARADHPNVVKVLASGVDGDRHWLAMELVDGADLSRTFQTLSAWSNQGVALREGHLSEAVSEGSRASPATAEPVADPAAAVPKLPLLAPRLGTGRPLSLRLAELFADAASGLQHLHDQGVVHRDVKPANLMLTADAARIVIMDLGLAQVDDASAGLTKSDVKVLGTLAYMAPEQLQRRLVDVDARADVYALGATLYEIATGRRFFDGDTEARLIQQVLHEQPLPPRKANPQLPVELAAVIQVATAKRPEDRYQQARAMESDLRAVARGEAIRGRPPGRLRRGWLWSKRHPALSAVCAFALLLVLGAGGGWLSWTKVRVHHFATWVQRGDSMEGVGAVESVAGRAQTWRLSYARGRLLRAEAVNGHGQLDRETAECVREPSYDDQGRVTRVVTFDHTGKIVRKYLLTPHEGELQVTIVDRNDLRASLPDSDVAMYRDQLDAGGHLARRLFFSDRSSPRQDESKAYGYEYARDARGLAYRTRALSPEGKPARAGTGIATIEREFDAQGLTVRERFLGSDDKPHMENGWAQKRVTRDAQGNPTEVTYADGDGAVVVPQAGFATELDRFDEQGDAVEIRYLDARRLPTTAEGVAIERQRFDALGNRVEQALFDVEDHPVARAGVAVNRWEYDPRGNITRRTRFGVDGRPAIDADGLHEQRYEYDARGNVTGISQYGLDGRLVVDAQGEAAVRYRYDERDQRIERRALGSDGQTAVRDTGCSIERAAYDERGLLTEKRCLSAEEKLRLDVAGHASEKRRYDEHGNAIEIAYFDKDGQPALGQWGYASVRSEFDDHGNAVRTEYRGKAGELVDNRRGFASKTAVFDDRGRVTRRSYFGASGKPVLVDGCASTELVYDEVGNQIEGTYYGLDGLKILGPEGVASWRATYDARGLLLERRNFDVGGQPVVSREGGATVRFTYDAFGGELTREFLGPTDALVVSRVGWARRTRRYDEYRHLVLEQYFGADGQPLLQPGGYGSVRFEYDALGDNVRREYKDALDRKSSEMLLDLPGAKKTLLALAAQRAAHAELYPGSGLVVAGVQTGGPSERAGVRRFDVLVACDGRGLNDEDGLERCLRTGDQPAKVRLLRDGKPLELSVDRGAPGVAVVAHL